MRRLALLALAACSSRQPIKAERTCGTGERVLLSADLTGSDDGKPVRWYFQAVCDLDQCSVQGVNLGALEAGRLGVTDLWSGQRKLTRTGSGLSIASVYGGLSLDVTGQDFDAVLSISGVASSAFGGRSSRVEMRGTCKP